MDVVHIKLLYALLIIATTFVGSILVDSCKRLSKMLRVLGLVGIPLTFIVTNLIKLLDFQLVLVVAASISSVAISLHAEGYYRAMFGITKYFQTVIDSCLALLILLFSSSLLAEVLIYWLLVDLLFSLVAITLEYGPEALHIAAIYLVMCVAPSDIAVLTIFSLVAYELGLEQALLMSLTTNRPLLTLNPLISTLIAFGLATKLGQFPLHYWLPRVHGEAPTHVSAMLSGLVIKLGIYCLLLTSRLFELDIIAYYVLLAQSIITIVYGSLGSVIQSNVKRMLAYSSMAYGGVMIALFVYYAVWKFEFLYLVLLAVIVFHILAKTLAFLNAALIYQIANTYDVYKLGYLYYISKKASFLAFTVFLNLLGAPPTMGFAIKVFLVVSALESVRYGIHGLLLVIAFTVFAVFAVAYSAKFMNVYISKIPRIMPRPIPIPEEILNSELFLAVTTTLTPIPFLVILSHTNTIVPVILATMSATYVALLIIFVYTLKKDVLSREPFREDVKYWLSGVET